MSRPTDLQRTIKQIVVPAKIPNPPSDLTDEETELWLEFFKSIEPDWITTAQYPVVKAYIRNVISADRCAKMINRKSQKIEDADGEFDADDLKALSKLTALLDTHHRGILANLRAMRLSNINLRSDKSERPTSVPRPWDLNDELEAEVIDEKGIENGEPATSD